MITDKTTGQLTVHGAVPDGLLELLKLIPEDVNLTGPFDMPAKPAGKKWQYIIRRMCILEDGHGQTFGDKAERVTFVDADAPLEHWRAHLEWILKGRPA
jgi:hypothetical protein